MWFKALILYYYLQLRFWRFSSRHQVHVWQQRRWQLQWKFLRKHSSFYAAIQSKEVPAPEALPLMDKATMLRHFDQINTGKIKLAEAMSLALGAEGQREFSTMLPGNLSVGLSSGTSGNRGIFVVSLRERAQWVAVILHRVIGWSWRRRKVAFFLRADNRLYQSVRSKLLSFTYFDLLKPFGQLVEALQACQPDILVAQPSVLHQLARLQKAGSLQVMPSMIISVAEVLEPEVKDFLEKTWGVRVQQVYQCTEGLLATSCEAGNLHFHEDLLVIQPRWLDAEKRIFYPVITDLNRRVQPIIHYLLDDLIHVAENPCSCGSPFLCISRIEGRADDRLLFLRKDGRMVWVLPDIIRRLVLIHIDADIHYQVEQVLLDKLIIRLENEDDAHLLQRIKVTMQKWCGEKGLEIPDLVFEGKVVEIPGKKFRRVIGIKGKPYEAYEFL